MSNSVLNKNITIPCYRGEGEALVNIIGKFAMTRTLSWRPIGYTILSRANTSILHAGDDILEDMIAIGLNLSSLQYEVIGNTDKDLLKIEYVVDKQLTIDDMNRQHPEVKCKSGIDTIITMLGESKCRLVVYFRKAFGGFKASQNLDFLHYNGETGSEIKVMPSNHSPIDRFTFSVEQQGVDKENVKVSIHSKNDNELELLKQATSTLIARLQETLQHI